MLVAKTEKGLTYFKTLFQKKSQANTLTEKENVPLKKWYRAICIPDADGKNFLSTIASQLPYVITATVIPKVAHSVPKL